METIYARVENGRVIDFPVTAQDIAVRTLPPSWYKPVVFDKTPELKTGQYASSIESVVDNTLHIFYDVKQYTPDEIFAKIYNAQISLAIVNTDDLTYLKQIIEAEASSRFERLAKDRGYDSLASLCSWTNSKVASYADEAQYAIDLRDAFWPALYQELGLLPNKRLPPTMDLFFKRLPLIQWS